MRPFCLSLFLVLSLSVRAAAAPASAAAPAAGRTIAVTCNAASTDQSASGEPPAWLLLASALALLVAGRLAGPRQA